MKTIQAPNEEFTYFSYATWPKCFLGGGISNCPNWQNIVMDQLKNDPYDYLLLNPRRDDWPEDPVEIKKQIKWEHQGLIRSQVRSFWFPKDTLCPITLFELGLSLADDNVTTIVGCDPEYKRKMDLQIQIPLYNKGVKIIYDLDYYITILREKMKQLCLQQIRHREEPETLYTIAFRFRDDIDIDAVSSEKFKQLFNIPESVHGPFATPIAERTDGDRKCLFYYHFTKEKLREIMARKKSKEVLDFGIIDMHCKMDLF